MEKKVLAFDFGASGGRAMCGTFDGDKISIEELHRFSNDPVILNGSMYWDVLRLFFEIKQGLIKAKKCGKIESIGIDTWGVDFGLIDEEGRLLENPVHYRDARTEGMIEESFKLIDKEKFYQITGNQFMDLNTAFQLLSLVKTRKELLEKADKMILMPDLFNYFLTGEKKAEYSIASTTQLLDAKKGEWSDEVIEALGIPKHIFPEIVPTGTKIGTLTDEICTELGLDKIDVMAVAGHDTQSALVSVPTSEEDFIFLSCGTWSLLGTELAEPIINEKSEHYNITNEGGYEERFPSLRTSSDCGVFRKAVVSGSVKEMSTDLASLRLWQKKLRHFRALLIRMHRNSHQPEIFRQESVNSARRQDSLFRKQLEKLFVASTRVLQ